MTDLRHPAIVRFDPPASEPALDRPRPDRLEQGDPLRRTWSLYEAPQGDLSAGIWACEVGRWRIAFPPGKDEYFHLLEGRVRLHDTQGAWTEFGPGEGGVIPGGFEGAFEVVEAVRKHFVVVDRGG
ncbi:MAG: hypothetical protein RIQ53_2510 [Pseudomonadota bacterium]|jgi:uncharacterized cupin superfamily protein